MSETLSYRKEILATIQLAHHFRSAFTPGQVYRYLRVPIAREVFDAVLADLQAKELVAVREGALFTRSLESCYLKKKRWSRQIFSRNRFYLSLLSRMPWVKYMALTGANAFESCQHRDDIDLFLVTAKNRLWICYLFLVVLSKVFRKREILCLNYLVDESNIDIAQQDYYTAVQLMQMIPLFNAVIGSEMIDRNDWIYKYLPNADRQLPGDDYYILKNSSKDPLRSKVSRGFISRLNRLIFNSYRRRLSRKYPESLGSGIMLAEGVAKLNRIDHHDIYQDVYQKIDRELEARMAI